MGQAAFDSRLGGKFHLVARLGEGGMAKVYLALAHGLGGFRKLVVLKALKEGTSAEQVDLRSMFLDEARLAARMHHPNVVQTMDVVEVEGIALLVMEYLDGQPLHRVLRRASRSAGVWRLPLHLRVLSDMLRGLHYAHELRDYDGSPLGLVHRDVSPPNVFVTYDGHVKLVDFGIAKVASSEGRTRVGVLKGKLAYMAPEHASGAALDRRADVFSAGVMLFEALAGQRFWQGHEEVEVLRRLLKGDLPDYAPAIACAPRRLRDACIRALAIAPEHRLASAAELQREIDAWIEESGTEVPAAELGTAASTLFAEERRKLAAIIEERSRSLEGPSSTPEPPMLSDLSAFSRPSFPPGAGAVLPGPISSSDVAVVREPPPSSGRRWWKRDVKSLSVVGLAVLLTSFVIAGLMRWSGRSGTPLVNAQAQAALSEKPLAAVTSAAPSMPTQDAPPAPSATLTLLATPTPAVWYFDGHPLVGNPVTEKLAADGSLHELRADAPGYVSVVRNVVADHDTQILVVLEPVRHKTKTRPVELDEPGKRQSEEGAQVSTSVVKASPPDSLLSEVPVTRPTRKLDRYNPYDP